MANSPEPLVRIELLGGFCVRLGDRALLDRSWGRRRARHLVELVALQRDRLLPRDAVLEALWPDLNVRAATNNLHKNLHHLRTALAERGLHEPLLELRDEALCLADGVAVDVDEFRAAAASARASGEQAAYDAALAAYAGDLLPEDAYEEWTLATREELRTLYLRLLSEAAAADEREERIEAAIERLEALLRAEPTDEDAHRRLMRLHVTAGSRHRAMRQYERCRDALERELGVAPSAETEALRRQLEGANDLESRARNADAPRHRRSADRSAPPPIGREDVLATAEESLDEALDGRGRLLLVAGEAGIGKSYLLDALAYRAEQAGALVLRGRAYEFDADVPYQAVREALRQLEVHEQDDAVRDLLARSAHLRRLLGESASAVPDGAPDLLRAELFDQLTRLVAALADQQPLVLYLDDLHAADDATLRLLHFLVRQIEHAPVLVLGGYRIEDGSSHPLEELRAALRREGRLREIVLEPLPEDAMHRLVETIFAPQVVDPQLTEEVVRRAAGNPLFAHELAHTLIEEHRARVVDGQWRAQGVGTAPVPGAVRDLVERRLQRLSEEAQDELNAVAVLARAVSFATLRRMVELPARAALDALDECLGAFFLHEEAAGYRFRHDLLRETVYERLSHARRAHLHRLAAEALLTEPRADAHVEDIGHHFYHSDEPWRAIPHLVASGRRAAGVFANEQAMELYRRALEVAREHEERVPGTEYATLLEELGDLERRIGDADAGTPSFEAAAARFEASGDGTGALRARGKAALGHIIRGDAAAASAHIEATRSTLTEQSPDSVVSRTYYLLAQLHWHSGEHRAALEAAEQALLAADAAHDPGQRAGAFEVLALACHSLGDWQRGVRYELDRQALGVGGFDSDEAFDAHL